MSKFSKALEKIQEERSSEEKAPKNSAASMKFPVGLEEVEASEVFWGERVESVKNTLPLSHIVMFRFPNSIIAEQYRMLRTSLQTQLKKEGLKVLLVSSSVNGEGKTVTATNLAAALAENGDAKVALVDADLRRGRIAEYLGFGEKRRGLSDFLSGDIHPCELMIRNSRPNLWIMGRGGAVKKPFEMVSSPRFHALIEGLRRHFDYVVMDAPPIMSVADAGILGREADGVLFVIQAAKTPKTVADHAQLLFRQSGVRILGYVMTNLDFQSADYRYYHHYHPYSLEENAAPKTFRGQANLHLKTVALRLRDLEEKFNAWWERRSLHLKEEKGRKRNNTE